MSSKVFSAAVVGLEAEIVEVEAEIGGGQFGLFMIVGLPDAAVSEARERVRSAVRNSGVEFPRLKITVNLAPAYLRKQGPRYDVPIALSIMAAKGIVPASALERSLCLGELALSGQLRPITGVLPAALAARRQGFKTLFIPVANAAEAALVPGFDIRPAGSLADIIDHLTSRAPIPPFEKKIIEVETHPETVNDMADVRGQAAVKRAMEIAAAGGHNMLMSGPPGSGKTLLARTLPSILPDLMLEEALEITKIYSVSGRLSADHPLIQTRPFRAPHHTASSAALIGGGAWPKPGELSLAHGGVLFLDEFGEFSRPVLESLRQPLEDGCVTVSRAAGSSNFPTGCLLVAAMNPCPCGYRGDAERACACSAGQVLAYRKKISGPILDRIDLHIEVPRLSFESLHEPEAAESSAAIKRRVEAARRRQFRRFKGTAYRCNRDMDSALTRDVCRLDPSATALLRSAVRRFKLSARAYFKVLKLSRTIADLAGREDVCLDHVAESLQYRPKLE